MNFLTIADMHLPEHKPDSHKGENGKALIVGGSEDYVGAVALAGMAALRSGCDLAVVAAPEKVAWAINCLSPDLITKKFKCSYFEQKHVAQVAKLAKDFDVVLIGNGIGERSDAFVKGLVKKLTDQGKPMVVDAQGIGAISITDIKGSVLTPHKKEFRELLKNSRATNKNLPRKLDRNVVLLKGKIDTVFSKTRTAYNNTGNEGMSVGGTGDVLAGLVAGFVAQDCSLFEAACNAAFINGSAGDMLKQKKGYAFIASDLAEDIKKVMKNIRRVK